MTVVRERDGDGHAVLMVRTDRGDLILDNQNGKVLRLEGHALRIHQAPVAGRCRQVGRAQRRPRHHHGRRRRPSYDRTSVQFSGPSP